MNTRCDARVIACWTSTSEASGTKANAMHTAIDVVAPPLTSSSTAAAFRAKKLPTTMAMRRNRRTTPAASDHCCCTRYCGNSRSALLAPPRWQTLPAMRDQVRA